MALGAARLVRFALAAAALGLLAPGAAAAERAAGINGSLNLVRFDTATPGDVHVRLITGLETVGEKAIGLDTRPATGELFLITTPEGVVSGPLVITRTYKLDPESAAATFVAALAGGVVPGAGDWQTGFDFQPVVDRMRVVNANNESYRINPNNGALAGDDTNLTYTAPATGPVTAVAYDRNVAPGPPGTVAPPGTLTTLYGIDVGSDRLVVQGGINGASPGGVNGGTITAIGPLGVVVDNSSDAGFDISPGGAAYAALRTTGVPNLHSVNLQDGAATAIGRLAVELRSLAILPPAVVTPPPPPPPPTDTTDPAIGVTRAPKRLSLRRFLRRGVSARVSPSEAVSLEVALLARARGARIARVGDLVLAERMLGVSSAARTVRLKPRRRLVGRARRFTVRLRVIATDAAGNRGRAVVRTIRVRR